jgi:hypothetical protein
MKIVKKVGLEIKMKDFYKCAKPLVDNEKLKTAIKSELYQTLDGIINGNYGNDSLSWQKIFFHELKDAGFIELTEYGKALYGSVFK